MVDEHSQAACGIFIWSQITSNVLVVQDVAFLVHRTFCPEEFLVLFVLFSVDERLDRKEGVNLNITLLLHFILETRGSQQVETLPSKQEEAKPLQS